MPRQRTPTAILETRGAFKHDPQRARLNEPKDNRALGDPPGRLPANVLPYWNELVDQCGSTLTRRHRWAVEVCARLMEKAMRERSAEMILELAREGELESSDIKALIRAETISSAEWGAFRSLLAALGMTPADQTKLSVPTEKPKNEFADLAEEARSHAGRLN